MILALARVDLDLFYSKVKCELVHAFKYGKLFESHFMAQGAPLAQLVEYQTLDHKVACSKLARGAVLCP